jgi:hypothetical protein
MGNINAVEVLLAIRNITDLSDDYSSKEMIEQIKTYIFNTLRTIEGE